MKNRAQAKNQKPKNLQKSKIMRLSKKEKITLYELLDVMTEPYPEAYVDRFDNEVSREIFFGIFKKLRHELMGW